MSYILYISRTKEDALKTLIETISIFTSKLASQQDAIALLSAPSEFCLAKLEIDKSLFNYTKGNLSTTFLNSVYEARIFSPTMELRWLNKKNGLGQAILLSENQEISWDEDSKMEVDQIKAIDIIPQRYLVWGKGTGETLANTQGSKWSKLATSRIGTIVVPVPQIEKGKHVQLIAQEYLQEKEYGNVVVIEERLIGLEGARE